MEIRTDERGVQWSWPVLFRELPAGWAMCGTCGRAWNDAVSTSVTPTPAGRCPFEHWHDDEDDDGEWGDTDDEDDATGLTVEDWRTVKHCLRVAAETFHGHCDELADVARRLRAGDEPTSAMWAPGEAGAKAADELARQHHENESDARELLAKIEGSGK